MEVKNKISEIEKVNLLISTAEENRKTNPAKVVEICCEAVGLAQKIDYKAGLSKALLLYGIICRQTSNYDLAYQNCNKALDLYYELGDLKGQSRALNSIANIH